MFGFVQKSLGFIVCVCFVFFMCALTPLSQSFMVYFYQISHFSDAVIFFYLCKMLSGVCASLCLSVCVCVLHACITIPQGSSNMHLVNGCSRKADTFRRVCEIVSPKRSSYYCEWACRRLVQHSDHLPECFGRYSSRIIPSWRGRSSLRARLMFVSQRFPGIPG